MHRLILILISWTAGALRNQHPTSHLGGVSLSARLIVGKRSTVLEYLVMVCDGRFDCLQCLMIGEPWLISHNESFQKRWRAFSHQKLVPTSGVEVRDSSHSMSLQFLGYILRRCGELLVAREASQQVRRPQDNQSDFSIDTKKLFLSIAEWRQIQSKTQNFKSKDHCCRYVKCNRPSAKAIRKYGAKSRSCYY